MAMLNNQAVRTLLGFTLGCVLFFIAFSIQARGTYQTPEAFLQEAFPQQVPKSQVVWVKGDVREGIEDILGHRYSGLRIRYWMQDQRSAWILEEIGKEEAITFGVVIDDQHISTIKVLVYRESRGEEIRHRAFTQQFTSATLIDNKLDRHIDGVSGATMSVRAMTDVARLALYLAGLVSK